MNFKMLFYISISFLFLIVFGCSSTIRRSYNLPSTYVYFAAQEAVATAGFDSIKMQNNFRIEGNRQRIVGFLVGQGGEHINVDLQESKQATDVTIVSKIGFVGFLAQRHMAKRTARYLDLYINENAKLKDKIIKGFESKGEIE